MPFLGYLFHDTVRICWCGFLQFFTFPDLWVWLLGKIHLLVSFLGISRFMSVIFGKFPEFMVMIFENFSGFMGGTFTIRMAQSRILETQVSSSGLQTEQSGEKGSISEEPYHLSGMTRGRRIDLVSLLL